MASGFTRRGWILFALMAVLWGVPYLLIKEAVDTISPPAIVAARTLIGGLVLLPIAIRSGALKAAARKWPWVVAFGLIEMAGPFLLLSHAEQELPSGLTGLLVATVPLFATLIAVFSGDRGALRPVRIGGLVIGFLGVAVIVAGPGVGINGVPGLLAAGEVLLVAVCYAIAPFIIARKLADVPSYGSIALALLIIGLAYLPWGIATTSELPSLRSGIAIVLLGLVCTALAFVVFFALIKEVGPVDAPLFTYLNPIVALGLGVVLLAEPFGLGLIIGAPIVLLGCWIAATGGRRRPRTTIDITPEPIPPSPHGDA